VVVAYRVCGRRRADTLCRKIRLDVVEGGIKECSYLPVEKGIAQSGDKVFVLLCLRFVLLFCRQDKLPFVGKLSNWIEYLSQAAILSRYDLKIKV